MIKKSSKRIKKLILIGKSLSKRLLQILVFVCFVFIFCNLLFFEKIFPNVSVAGISLAGKTSQHAKSVLEDKIKAPEKIILIKKGETFEIPLSQFGFAYDFDSTVNQAFRVGRDQKFFQNFYTRLTLLQKPTDLDIKINFEKEKLRENISVIAGETVIEPIYPTFSIQGENVLVKKGSPGEDMDQERVLAEIENRLKKFNSSPVEIISRMIDPSLSWEEAENYQQRLVNLLDKSLVLTFKENEYLYARENLLKILNPKGGYKPEEIAVLVSSLTLKLNRNPQNPVFVFKDGKVQEFSPSQDGVEIETESLRADILNELVKLETISENRTVINIKAKTTPPEYQIEDVNNLGIKELLGKGVSRFSGSIPSRIFNIELASSKFNGVLIKPGEIFSFNQVLGDVSVFTGYKQAYIIKDGKTILGDGGGVCQVSTTLFRAALNAGLPIIERRAHAYRVSYYEQGSPVGLDATVYAPTTDLKIKNDTQNHLLIQTSVDKKSSTLEFEIYGTADGRKATLTKPKVTDVVSPPEDLYTDDPTLPGGIIKQIDFKAWGSKVSFYYKVERNGEIIFEKNFVSNYRPWQAKFLRGTGPTN